jgi:hypothetical protein
LPSESSRSIPDAAILVANDARDSRTVGLYGSSERSARNGEQISSPVQTNENGRGRIGTPPPVTLHNKHYCILHAGGPVDPPTESMVGTVIVE